MKEIENYKTMCCNADWYVKGRGNFRCSECDADISMDILYLYKAITDSKDSK